MLSEAVRFLVEGRLAEHGQRQQVGDEARFVRQPLRGGVPLPLAHLRRPEEGQDEEGYRRRRDRGDEDLGTKADSHE